MTGELIRMLEQVNGGGAELKDVSAGRKQAYLRCVEQLIAKAQGEHQIFVSSTGAATGLGAILTAVPGASKMFLGSEVPYHRGILQAFLEKGSPERAVSEEVAVAMANRSYLKGQEALVLGNELQDGKPRIIGVGLTGAIASGPERRGKDRIHIALRTLTCTVVGHFEFEKGGGLNDREWQNELAETIALDALCECVGVQQIPLTDERVTAHSGTIEGGEVHLSTLMAPPVERDQAVLINPDGTVGRLEELDPARCLIYPGSFRSFHCGHDLAAQSARDATGKEVIFEISSSNKDKAAVSWEELLRRSVQFRGLYPVIVRSDAPSFVEKANAYPAGMQFVVGFDTATRILDKKYYSDSWRQLEGTLDFFDTRGTRFYVLGRHTETEGVTRFQTYRDIWCPVGKAHLFLGLAGQHNISATDLMGSVK